LLNKFKSISAIKNATIESLQKEIGQAKALILFNYFKDK